MIVVIEHGKGSGYPSVWLAKSRHAKAEYNANKRPYFAMYHTGELPPNYPLPVTAGNAALSVYHQDGLPLTIWPYAMVKDELSFLK